MADESDDASLGIGECCKNFWTNHWQGVVSVAIPIIFLPLLLKWEQKEYRCLYLVCVMALYWITECITPFMSALFPVVVLPAFGILDSEKVCQEYFRDPLVVFLLSIMMGLAIEYCKLHQRLALLFILTVGSSIRRLFFCIIITSSFISWWIPNTATTAIMVPIVKGILQELDKSNVVNYYMPEEEEPLSPELEYPHPSKISMAFYLGVAYASSIGGCATLIGTPANLAIKRIYDKRFKKAPDAINFAKFMAYSVPVVVILTILLYFFLNFWFMGFMRPNSKENQEIKNGAEQKEAVMTAVKDNYNELGPISMHQFQVILLFGLMLCLLFTRSPGFFKGWADYYAADILDSLPLAFVVIAIFMLPISYTFFRTCYARNGPFPKDEIPSLLAWKFLQTNVPWGFLFLLGGGFALGAGVKASGLSKMLGNSLHVLKDLPPPLIQLLTIVAAVFLTAFTCNACIVGILVPVLCEMAGAVKVHPLYLVYPAGLACSMAFHLPVSTPPNAISAGYAHIKTKYMGAAGILPTVAAILLLWLNGQTWQLVVYPKSNKFPEWAS